MKLMVLIRSDREEMNVVPHYDLIAQPWIPCVAENEQTPRELSLREVLARAPDIIEISDPSPLVSVSLHRLLLAVLHRAFGPGSPDAWAELWERDALDMAALDGYLDEWRHRFDLFDEKRPFYQVADLGFEGYERPISAMVLELNLGDRTLFEHTIDERPPWFSPARAARELVTHQNIALGGLLTFDDAKHRSAKGAPLAKGAVVLVRGRNLFETLMLNLHQYDPGENRPFESTTPDLPAWERDDVARPADRQPTGYLDYLTWQSRRIRLHPEETPDGGITVRYVVIMKGSTLPEWWNDTPRETMLGYRRNLKARGNPDPWDPITFRADRAFWRDSLPLFQAVQTGEREFERPRMLDWLDDLAWEHGVLDRSRTHNVDVYGLSSDRQKIFLWRHERFPLPLTYLHDDQLFARLREAVDLAEAVGRVVNRGVWYLARLLLAPEADKQEGRDPDRSAVTALAESFETGRAFWARLDEEFAGLIERLAEDRRVDAHQDVYYGDTELPRWRDKLRAAAYRSWDDTVAGLDLSARELKATARASRTFRIQLAEALRPGHREQGKE